MNPSIESVFNQAESRYLQEQELSVVGDYVQSIPSRLEVYRVVRDKEVDILQAVADQLQGKFSDSDVKRIERSIKNAILALRACAMGMLLNDENYVQERIQWLLQTQKNNNLQEIDKILYPLLDKQLETTLGASKMGLLKDKLDRLRTVLTQDAPVGVPSQAAAPTKAEPVDELNLESLF